MTSDDYGDEHNNEFDPARDLEELLRNLFNGMNSDATNFDPAQFAQAAGLPLDEGALQEMLGALQHAMFQPRAQQGIDWSLARKTAIDAAKAQTDSASAQIDQSVFSTASLWLDEATSMGAVADAPRTINRVTWVQNSIDTWIEMVEPVAESVSQALLTSLRSQLPEEMQGALGGAAPILNSVGATMFALQLGQIVGSLSSEVLSGGDVGVPLFAQEGQGGGTLIPENVAAFADGLDQERTEIELFLATRELAHARLFRHAPWLRSHLLSMVEEYARGIDMNMDHLEDLSFEFDPQNPEEIQELLRSGKLIPPKTPRQEAAHQRLETALALIDGYVDVVTRQATRLLPGGPALAEMVRRRRAAGGPSERAFATLVGLELRPRMLREAAALWSLVEERGGIDVRDGLWAHPDLLPTHEELTQPEQLLTRLGLSEHGDDEAATFEAELRKFLESSPDDAGDQGSQDTK